MEVRAKVRHLPISAQKIRLVCDQVRGMDAEEALTTLQFMPQRGAHYVTKLIESALANAEENFELNRQDLFVWQIFADEGPRQFRYKAGARGRYKPRVKQSSHVSLILREYEQ
ncbi:MAG: 50S ribosomal protein L22 [Chloroflexi bacterium]|nr:50S ribosomal protein L22 [Chloroflexota bacterium]